MTQRAYLYLTLTTLFWGANAVAGKLAVGVISPMLLTTMRWSLAVIVLLSFALPQIRRDMPAIRRHWPVLAALGAVGFAAFNITLYSALEYTSAINVVIMQAGMPLVIFLANFLIFRVPITGGQVLGFFLTVAGVMTVASGGSIAQLLSLTLNRGDAIMLVAVLVYGGYTVALRYRPVMHWQSMMAVMATAAIVASIPFTLWEIAVDRVVWPGIDGFGIALFTAIFPSLISQVLYIQANGMIGSNRAGLFVNLVPIFGTILSVVILRETLHIYHVVALVLVMGGIWLAERVKRDK
ncbi:DMT family transporter [Pseudohoeflea suaedae]|uniref:DMT family transporter n=1 Tax=Pseudohoeflea suaedae TaxID=877384 RepID=A0A4R5PIQ9_9HYPH|nr:DMT family transporter [Pseudohoeflea suaedae]TDH35133.1 DMT family transporter [Pseudohoeflea suaedae]